jgi:hypothetical protein
MSRIYDALKRLERDRERARTDWVPRRLCERVPGCILNAEHEDSCLDAHGQDPNAGVDFPMDSFICEQGPDFGIARFLRRWRDRLRDAWRVLRGRRLVEPSC